MRLVGKPLRQQRREPRFANAGLARDERRLSFAFLGLGPEAQENFDLCLAPHERRKAASMQRLEAAFNGPGAQDGEGPSRPPDAFERQESEVLQLEEVADEPPRAFGDDDAVRFCDPLQPRGQVRRVPDDAVLLRFAGADEVADDDDARSDADPRMQWGASRSVQPGRGGDDRERRAQGILGVVLVSPRIAEIGEHAITHVFGDEAAVGADEASAAFVIDCEDLSHVLGIEPRSNSGRADEIDKHHGEITAFRRRSLLRFLSPPPSPLSGWLSSTALQSRLVASGDAPPRRCQVP